MSHERSETIESDGRWFNVKGGTRDPLKPVFPFERESYPTLGEAVTAARQRSARGGAPVKPSSLDAKWNAFFSGGDVAQPPLPREARQQARSLDQRWDQFFAERPETPPAPASPGVGAYAKRAFVTAPLEVARSGLARFGGPPPSEPTTADVLRSRDTGEARLARLLRYGRGALEIASVPFTPGAVIGGDIGAAVGRHGGPVASGLERIGRFLTPHLDPFARPTASEFTEASEMAGRALGGTVGGSIAPWSGLRLLGRAVRRAPMPPTPQPALPPGATRALPRGAYEAGPAPPPVREGIIEPPRALPPGRYEMPESWARVVPEEELAVEREAAAAEAARQARINAPVTPKRPFREEGAVPVEGRPLAGELLDQYGRPVRAPAPTMSERERLRRFYRTAPEQPPASRPEPESSDVRVRDLRAPRPEPSAPPPSPPPAPEPVPPAPAPERPTPPPGQRPVAESQRLAETATAAPPIRWNQRPPGLRRLDAYASEDRRFLIEQVSPDVWRIRDQRLRETAEFPTFHEARAWASERLRAGRPEPPAPPPGAPPATPSAPQETPAPPPRFERTQMGDQAVIPGTPGRQMPTSKIHATRPQAGVEGTPLFERPPTEEQMPLREPPQRAAARPISPGTVNLRDPDEVATLIRGYGGINFGALKGEAKSVPLFLRSDKGVQWDGLLAEIGKAQGRDPKEVERRLMGTLDRYSELRRQKRLSGGGGRPPEEPPTMEEWESMTDAQRRALDPDWLGFSRTGVAARAGTTAAGAAVGGTQGDTPEERLRNAAIGAAAGFAAPSVYGMLRAVGEDGALIPQRLIDTWNKAKRRLPQEEFVRRARPGSPVITEVERFNVGLADRLKALFDQPFYKALRRMTPDQLNDAEERAIGIWDQGGRTPHAYQQAVASMPGPVQAYLRYRDARLRVEQAARRYLGLDPIPTVSGPYLPRLTDREMEDFTLGGGELGTGRTLQTTVRGHQQHREFETQREGEQAGFKYQDRRNAVIMREWQSLKLGHTAALMRNLEGRALFRTESAAAVVSPQGRGFPVEQFPGAQRWWAPTEAEAKFLVQNLSEPKTAGYRGFVHFGNVLVRNPSLFNPLPHITKNMAAKYLLARGPVGMPALARDAVEYARGTGPLLPRFKQAMPFSESAEVAESLLHDQLVGGPVQEALKLAHKTLGLINRGSSNVIFKWADPAMRYSLWKHYIGQGMSDLEAANHSWVDLIRYGTRSNLTDFWKSIPLNFFVPWRTGTWVSLLKQTRNHPVRTALLIGGIDYLRELRYRRDGKWTHLPWDYVENPLAIALQNRDPKEIAGILGTTALFGPGGAFAGGQLVDTLNDIRGRGEWDRTKNMFWGLSQLYNLPKEWQAFERTGDVKYLADMLSTIAFGEHTALSYKPRRLMESLPESLPGMRRSLKVEEAEALQERRQQLGERIRERKARRPRQSIEELIEEGRYR